MVDNIFKNLMNCQKQMGMNSKEIIKEPVPGLRDTQAFRQAVERIVHNYRDNRRDQRDVTDLFFIMVVNYESDYQNIKNVFTDLNVMSQCIRKYTASKMNMSVGSNIMKQINSKLGGVSVRLKLPKFMSTYKTMIVGIDVCHASKNSVVGFVASTDLNCTSFYQDIICQAKG